MTTQGYHLGENDYRSYIRNLMRVYFSELSKTVMEKNLSRFFFLELQISFFFFFVWWIARRVVLFALSCGFSFFSRWPEKVLTQGDVRVV